ncbi:hypothetical protein JOC37_001657 [Desulfohalotomaculum tongense]|uniref:hypothetical protein n=1 Tax=Desulforadius tongensis TaxID=1216062 RepID=UPI00195A0E91|nr:hypothetical protein [Desulforadius tongensis]MBM7855264.1 hypothetical protein [Desulforadius tongensis]
MKHGQKHLLLILIITLAAVIMVGCSVPDNIAGKIPFLGAGDKEVDSKQVQDTDQKDKQLADQKNKAKETNSEEKGKSGGEDSAEKKGGEKTAAETGIKKEPASGENKGPKLIINLPEQMTTAHNKLKISGVTAGGCTVYVNGEALRVRSDGSFNTEVTLKPGDNEVQVVSIDKNGNSTLVNRRINFKVRQPSLKVFAPQESTSASVEVSGHTDPGCTVYLNNTKVKADSKGSFSGSVELMHKGDNIINVVSVNDYGVSTRASKVIRGIPPRLEVAAPEMVTDDKVTISGVTDTNSSVVVLVGSDEVQVNNNNGTFSVQLDLEPGINDFTVMAINIFGTTEKPVTVLYDDYNDYLK